MKSSLESIFVRFSRATSRAAGNPITFILALFLILGWAILGPVFHFSDTWQLVINTTTTIITFLMVFVIQNTQNRDSEATQIKLDEIIRSVRGAHNALLDLEELSEEDLARFRAEYGKLAAEARKGKKKKLSDTGTPDIKLDESK